MISNKNGFKCIFETSFEFIDQHLDCRLNWVFFKLKKAD
jgi:hypothetical protein